ncbi:SufD family Fe-S cluster assembly protein [Candidatus Nanohalococcus occultus]|uniref:SufD family Fe-S cluster assembly protein n=1 Tax=Candidatus Nanohalococcus occultus TaxID=2978047 RepID=UPI0039DFCE97
MSLETFKQKAKELVEQLDNPASIRTPGRTWTRYPELSVAEKDDAFEPEIKAKGEIEVKTGAEAFEAAGEKFMELLEVDENKLNAVHVANLNSVVYIRAEGRAEVSINYRAESDLFNHLVVETEESAELQITESFEGSAENVTSFDEFYLSENSTVNYGCVQSVDADFIYSRKKAVLEDYSKINWLNSSFGGQLARTKIETLLKGDGTETEKLATWYPTGQQHIDTSLHVRHMGENTKCQMDSRAVVDDEARSVYEGLQKVEEVAEDTSSFQDEEVLVLSDKAEVDASPKLMIENPDVEASHAASTGSIDDKKQHYIQSRGLNDDAAEKLIVKGFFEPVLQEIELPELKEKVRQQVRKKLKE